MNEQVNVGNPIEKIGYTNLSWLLGVYHYDQGKASKEWLAQSMGVQPNQVAQQVEEIRQLGFYRNFYAKVSEHLDRQWNVPRTDLLSRMPMSQEGVTQAFRVLSDRQVRPDQVAQSGQGVQLLTNPVVNMLLGNQLEHLPEQNMAGWQKLLAESLLLAAQQEVRELMSAKAQAKEDESYPIRIETALTHLAQLEQNYSEKGNEPTILPEVLHFMESLDKGCEACEEAFQALSENTLAVNQAVEYLLGVQGFWKQDQPVNHVEILDELMPMLSETEWFEDFLGHRLEGVDSDCLLAVQVPVAEAYERMLDREPQRLSEEERVVVDQSFADMEQAISNRAEIAAQVQQMLADQSAEQPELSRNWMSRQESLQAVSRRVGPMTMEDYVQIESYLKELEQQARDYAESLRLGPDGDTFRKYNETIMYINKLNERVSHRLDPNERKLEKVGGAGLDIKDRFVRLYYKESTGELAIASKPTLDKAWRVIDYLIREADAVGYARAFDAKRAQLGIEKPDAAGVEQDLKAYQALGADKTGYGEIAFTRDGQGARLSNEDIERLAKEFEHKKAVDFDLANEGVADVVQTDANRAEYQEKLDRENNRHAGKGRGM